MSAIYIDILSAVLTASWASLFFVLWLEFGAIRHHAAPARQRRALPPAMIRRLGFSGAEI